MPQVMIHDDDCGEPLDKTGTCPVCKIHPDTQSTAFVAMSTEVLTARLKEGRTFLGQYRVVIERDNGEEDRE